MKIKESGGYTKGNINGVFMVNVYFNEEGVKHKEEL